MSESAITVVELSLDAESARERAAAVRDWLLSLGVVQVNAKRDDLWQPSEFRAGPNVLRAVTQWGPGEANLANNGVDIVMERESIIPLRTSSRRPVPRAPPRWRWTTSATLRSSMAGWAGRSPWPAV